MRFEEVDFVFVEFVAWFGLEFSGEEERVSVGAWNRRKAVGAYCIFASVVAMFTRVCVLS